MGLGLGLGAAAILGLADRLSLDRQRAQLEDLVALSADRTAETVHRAATSSGSSTFSMIGRKRTARPKTAMPIPTSISVMIPSATVGT